MEHSEQEDEPKTRRIDLDAAERKVLLKACVEFRSSLPVYLQSGQSELRLVEAIIRKLS